MSLIRLGTLVGGLVAGMGGPAAAYAGEDAPQPSVLWERAGQLEVGGVFLNDASGDHPLRLFVGLRGVHRPGFRLTLLGGYSLAVSRDGPTEVRYLNLLHRVYGRADLAWGDPGRQFYLGAGPGVFVQQFRVSDGNEVHSGVVPSLGAVYALGFRWSAGGGLPVPLPMAVEFGGQYHHQRNDFLVTFLIGAGR